MFGKKQPEPRDIWKAKKIWKVGSDYHLRTKPEFGEDEIRNREERGP